MKMLEKIVTGAQIGDTFTHPDYQRRGIFTNLLKATDKDSLVRKMDFIYGAPNENALPVYERSLDYKRIPVMLRSMVKPLFPGNFLKAKLRFAPLAAALSPLIAVASKIIFAASTKSAARSSIIVTHEPSFPDDMDAFWDKAAKYYDVMLVRTKEYLQWRFVTNPDDYSILIARDTEGTVLGYMVTKIILISEDVPVGFIIDFLTLEDNPNIYKQLLVYSFRDFYKKKANLAYALTIKGSFYDRILLRVGFLPYHKVPLICYRNELGESISSQVYRWHFTMGDCDGV